MPDAWSKADTDQLEKAKLEARARQETETAINHALAQMQDAGARNIVKVAAIGETETKVGGYVTLLASVIGRTPLQIEKVLGLKPGHLAKGAHIYRLNRLPLRGEFDVRGYTTLPDGVRLPLGKTKDPGGYPPGEGVIQWRLTGKVDAAFLYELPPGEAFSIFNAQPRSALSGADWWHANQAKFPNSSAIADLAPGFREKVENFIKALNKAGAHVEIAATRRNAVRAHLMHYSFRLSKGEVKAANVPAVPGCEINWVHPSEALSRQAAKEMAKLFQIAYQPSLTSLHIAGKAIDMAISWTGTIKVEDAKGRLVEIGAPQSGAKNLTLHRIGKSYGVHKLLSDKPHWSINGH